MKHDINEHGQVLPHVRGKILFIDTERRLVLRVGQTGLIHAGPYVFTLEDALTFWYKVCHDGLYLAHLQQERTNRHTSHPLASYYKLDDRATAFRYMDRNLMQTDAYPYQKAAINRMRALLTMDVPTGAGKMAHFHKGFCLTEFQKGKVAAITDKGDRAYFIGMNPRASNGRTVIIQIEGQPTVRAVDPRGVADCNGSASIRLVGMAPSIKQCWIRSIGGDQIVRRTIWKGEKLDWGHMRFPREPVLINEWEA